MTLLDNFRYRMGRDKRGGSVGFMVETIPFVIMVALVAAVVFGVSLTYYAYDITVRDAEARLLAISVDKCLMKEGVIDLDEIGENDEDRILEYCGIDKMDRLYASVEVLDSSGERVRFFSEGDSGLDWARDLILTGNAVTGFDSKNVEKIAKYNPGYFEFNHSVVYVFGGQRSSGKVKVEAKVAYE